MPDPDVSLRVGSGSHAAQTARIMERIEPTILERKPDWVLVYGDVNSTLGAALVSAKLGVRVAHVEAGLRANDRTMPEEINRLVVDHLADLLFTPSEDGDVNLRREGIPEDRICRVGNVMVDSLVRLLPEAEKRWEGDKLYSRAESGARNAEPKVLALEKQKYVLVTLHRPSNVDDPRMLSLIMSTLEDISATIPVIFPVHPRTRSRLSSVRHPRLRPPHLHIIEPLGYLEFLALQLGARVVITDSGGIQEETTYLGIPCLTVRENTERPVTVTLGTNTLVGRDMAKLKDCVGRILCGKRKAGMVPPLWDGHAAERIASRLVNGTPRGFTPAVLSV
jgi:UDP-N-acetylglucosamine 2-epimerase (non-hydrolysing)